MISEFHCRNFLSLVWNRGSKFYRFDRSDAIQAPFILLLRDMSVVVGLCRRAIPELWQQGV
jgi:hypothetical protein